MRILLVTNTYGLFGERNGVERTYRSLVPELTARGIEVDVLTYGPQDLEYYEDGARIITHRPIGPLRFDDDVRIDATLCPGVLRRLAGAYDVAYSGTPDPLGWIAARIAKRDGIPFVTTYHTRLGQYARIRCARLGQRMAGIAERIVENGVLAYHNRSDLVLAPNIRLKEQLANKLDVRVELLDRGVDTTLFSPTRRERKEDDRSVRLVYVGRIAPEKGLSTLVHVHELLAHEELRIVGDGPYREELERLLPRAVFTGKRSGVALAREYADSDVFLFPSVTDTFGNVVREAMASGVPAVVMDADGPRDQIIDGVTGRIANDATSFAQAAVDLVGDAKTRTRMGAAARDEALRHTWRANAQRFVDLLGTARSNRL